MPSGLSTSKRAPNALMLRTTQEIAAPPKEMLPVFRTRVRNDSLFPPRCASVRPSLREQAKRVHGDENGRAGVGENRGPQSGQPDDRGDQENGLETQCDGNVLPDVDHGPL